MKDLIIYKNSIDEINQLHKEIEHDFLDALDRGLRIGELLIQEKKKLKHGKWIDWVKENLVFNERQGQKYIQLFKNQRYLNANSSSFLAESSINSTLSVIREMKKSQKKAKTAKEDEQKKREFDDFPESPKIWLGKFQEQTRKIQPDSIDAIITDPPYSIEHINDWKSLSRIAKRILKPSGFLITYSGILNLNEVFKVFDKNLIFYWQFILIHEGVKQLINPRNIFCGYKPILIYQKEPFKRISNQIDDLIKGAGREKEYHEWQQAEKEIGSLIENFTSPNDLILDPFAGSGTIPIACFKLKRKSIAIDDNEQNLKNIEKRLEKAIEERMENE